MMNNQLVWLGDNENGIGREKYKAEYELMEQNSMINHLGGDDVTSGEDIGDPFG